MSLQYMLQHSLSICGLEFPGMTAGLVLLLLSVALFYFVRRIYRIHLHPLSSFKGLPEACVSEDWLYKVTKSGTAEQTFEALHRKYKTEALRIGPDELHITDINLYRVIYNQSKPFLKHAPFYDGFNTPHTVFAEIDPDLHKTRRRMLNPLFSRVGIFKLEPIIQEKIRLLSSKISRLCDSKEIDIYNAVRLLTTEIITEFTFAKPANLIEEESDDLDSWFLDAFDVGSRSIVETQYSSLLRLAIRVLPTRLVETLNTEICSLFRLQRYAENCMRHWQKAFGNNPHPVVFNNLQSISDTAKVSEAMDILIAGADTTASTLTAGFFHILSNSNIKERLVREIDEAMPESESMISLQSLEKVEYLTACVKESIRVGMAVPGRLPRVVPDRNPFIVEGKVVPPGTIVGMSAYAMHTSMDAWGPDAREFNPDRWIGPASKGLEQWLCTFSKGARMCIGQNLAQAEINLAFAYIFRNYELSLPDKYAPPKAIDRFTLQYEKPGLPVIFKPRQAKEANVDR